jgi:hypothetical protein
MDDEYFRLILHSREDLSDHPDVVKMRETIKRSFLKPSKVRLFIAYCRSIRPVDVVTPAGIFIRRQLGVEADMNRLRRVVVRMVKAYFFHEKGYRMPDAYEACAVSEDTIRKWPSSAQANVQEALVKPLLTRAPITLGDSAFSYRAAFDRNDPNASAWMFVFYGRARFIWTDVASSKKEWSGILTYFRRFGPVPCTRKSWRG